ncbi:tripartite motif-containing protein 3-like [Branchiostoma floridae x Branchiostoma belcheri]
MTPQDGKTTIMAAAPSSLGTQIREELSCSICLELFTRPKVLPCQHTFCQDCLQRIAGTVETFQCPNCRQQVEVPPEGVSNLPDNHLVTSLCDQLQKQASVSEETKEKQGQAQPGNKCSIHPTEEVKLYCKQCQVPICVDCVEENHDGHPTSSLKKALQEREALITEGRGILETYCSFIRGLREKEKGLDDQKQQTVTKIEAAYRHACDQMHQKLTEEKDSLLSEVETNHRQNQETIRRYRDEVLADVVDLSAICDAAEQTTVREGEFLVGEASLAQVVQKFGEKTLPYTGQCQHAVFKPVDSKELLGRVIIPSATRKQNQTDTYVRTLTFGEAGAGPGQLSTPIAVAVSREGEVFVANVFNQGKKNKHIQVFTLEGGYILQLPTLLSERSSRPDSITPHAVAIDKEGNVVVVGTASGETYVGLYTKQCFLVKKFSLDHKGWQGAAVDHRNGTILIAQTIGNDPENLHSEVQVFLLSMSGLYLRTVGRQQGMKDARYITVDGEGNILASDHVNHCVYVYKEGGQFKFKFGSRGSDEGQLKNPLGICADRAGNIIVADWGNKRVEMFDKTGKFIKHITTDIQAPCAVAMGPQGQLVVTDAHCNTITIFGTN